MVTMVVLYQAMGTEDTMGMQVQNVVRLFSLHLVPAPNFTGCNDAREPHYKEGSVARSAR